MGRKKLAQAGSSLRVAGLFAGIGGIELGLDAAGHRTLFLCEIDPGAQRVLQAAYPDVPLKPDVRTLQAEAIPEVDLLTGGFPCTDLSQAGRTAGIDGEQSGLVRHVFRILEAVNPTWLLLENVPFMLQLEGGRAMKFLVEQLEDAGYMWAYRVVDARAFGLPQRRQRVILLASRTEDPRQILFFGDAGVQVELRDPPDWKTRANGFYWTEGIRGLGWAVDAVPTLKGGSTIGIPSPPAIWLTSGELVTPEIRDAERLQGFKADWTLPAIELPGEDETPRAARPRKGHRWKLVGNAVSVPVARWVGERLRDPRPYDDAKDEVMQDGDAWPKAAWGKEGKAHQTPLSSWPVRQPYKHLEQFLRFPPRPLTLRGAEGFLARARTSTLRFPDGLLDAVEAHIDGMRRGQASDERRTRSKRADPRRSR